MDTEDINSPENIEKRINENLLLKISHELDLLDGNPRMQIFVTHGFLELLVSALVKHKTKNGKKITSDNRSFPYSIQLVILNEINVITNDQYIIYDWFRKLRNKAAHEPLFNLTNKDLQIFSSHRNVSDFSRLCFDLTIQLWNNNIDILVPLFTPTLMNINEKPI